MIGQIGLAVRIALYVAAGWIASMGWADFNGGTGELTINLAALADWVAAGAVVLGTFVSSRVVKRLGGAT